MTHSSDENFAKRALLFAEKRLEGLKEGASRDKILELFRGAVADAIEEGRKVQQTHKGTKGLFDDHSKL